MKVRVAATERKRIAMERKRALECIAETALRQEKYSVSKSQKRAIETAEESLQQKKIHVWHAREKESLRD